MISFKSYFTLSVIGMFSVVLYACYTREQFYTIILFLVTSKISFLLAGNLLVACALLIGNVTKSIFLGRLRDIEVELLVDRCKYSITETLLALTIFRNELTPQIIMLFGALLFIKVFHWLAKSRLDYLQQLMPIPFITHIRLTLLLIILGISDSLISFFCIKYTLTAGRTVFILFGFEFGVLLISVFNYACRYTLHVLDSRFENGLTTKGLYTMLIDLICDGLKFVIYAVFFSLVFVYYGLPIHIVRDVWMAFQNFEKQLRSFIRYLRLTMNLDTRFPDAIEEELQTAGDCLICREGMERAKKLPCGHLFHLDCLRLWLQHQQTCPLCRADIPLVRTATTPAAGAPVVAVGAGGVPEVAPAAAQNESTRQTERGTSEGEEEKIRKALDVPGFFIVDSDDGVAVHSSASLSSSKGRMLSPGTVVFATSRSVSVEGAQHKNAPDLLKVYQWLQLPDGWVLEKHVNGRNSEVHLFPFTAEDVTGVSASKETSSSTETTAAVAVGLTENELNQLPRAVQHARSSNGVGGGNGSTAATVAGAEGSGHVASALSGALPFSATINSPRDIGMRVRPMREVSSAHGGLRPMPGSTFFRVTPISRMTLNSDGTRVEGANTQSTDLNLDTLRTVQQHMTSMAISINSLQEELASTQTLLHQVLLDYSDQKSKTDQQKESTATNISDDALAKAVSVDDKKKVSSSQRTSQEEVSESIMNEVKKSDNTCTSPITPALQEKRSAPVSAGSSATRHLSTLTYLDSASTQADITFANSIISSTSSTSSNTLSTQPSPSSTRIASGTTSVSSALSSSNTTIEPPSISAATATKQPIKDSSVSEEETSNGTTSPSLRTLREKYFSTVNTSTVKKSSDNDNKSDRDEGGSK